jgi:hypothetical protein
MSSSVSPSFAAFLGFAWLGDQLSTGNYIEAVCHLPA